MLQAWQLSRSKLIKRIQEKSMSIDEDYKAKEESTTRKLTKISWNKNVEPGPSILKHNKYFLEKAQQQGFDKRKVEREDSCEDITMKLDKIGQSIEKITEILMRNELVDKPLSTTQNKKDMKESKDDMHLIRGRNFENNQFDEERSRSLDAESEQRSASFQDLKDKYQIENQAEKEKVIVVIAKNKDKKANKQIGEKSKQMKVFERKSEKINHQDLKTEIQNKLKSKRSIDKPSSKFLHGAKKRSRHKVLSSFNYTYFYIISPGLVKIYRKEYGNKRKSGKKQRLHHF